MTRPAAPPPPDLMERLVSASFGSLEELRLFTAKQYGETPPSLVWVAGIPSTEGGGVRYEYADGAWIEAVAGRWTWHAPHPLVPPEAGEWDPIRSLLSDTEASRP